MTPPGAHAHPRAALTVRRTGEMKVWPSGSERSSGCAAQARWLAHVR